MNDFLHFIDKLAHKSPVHVQIYYSKTMDWCIYVYKKNCAVDYPDSMNNGSDAVLCSIQDSDMELAFAKAHVEVKNWLLHNDGGY